MFMYRKKDVGYIVAPQLPKAREIAQGAHTQRGLSNTRRLYMIIMNIPYPTVYHHYRHITPDAPMYRYLKKIYIYIYIFMHRKKDGGYVLAPLLAKARK